MKQQKRIANTLSIAEILKRFSTETKAVRWLESVRWGGKPVCAHCGGVERIRESRSKKQTYWCGSCRKQFTIKTGSVMHASNIPVRKWAIAMYYVLTARKGVSAMQLSKELDLTYKTAWFLLHRIREACGKGDFDLSRVVEVDETYLGGKEANKHEHKKRKAGRGAVGKMAVLGIRERGGRVKATPVTDTGKPTLQGIIQESVVAGSTVYTDEHRAYLGLQGYDHAVVCHSAREFVNGMAHTNGIESVWAVLKRGFNGVYHHWSVKHCGRYVNEFTFRLNEGNCEVDTLDRMRALGQRMGGQRLSYKTLIA